MVIGNFIPLSAATPEPAIPEGAGTQNNPFLITSVENLLWMSQTANQSAGRYYQLKNSIDASSTSTWNNGQGFSPIGTQAAMFRGIFNGNNYAITGLTIQRYTSNFVGFFGYCSQAILANLRLLDCNITGASDVGGLVGYADNCTISTVATSGMVTAYGNCAGGLAGEVYRSTVTYSCSTASIVGNSGVGGLIGQSLTESNTQACYASGSVSANLETSYAGGLIGWNHGPVVCCYARGSVSGQYRVGGLCGQDNGTITQCYATGRVSGADNYVAGIAGYGNTNLRVTYWDVQTTGRTYCIGNNKSFATNYARSTEQMKNAAYYSGWSFDSIWGISSTVNDGYPYLNNIANVAPDPDPEPEPDPEPTYLLTYTWSGDNLHIKWDPAGSPVLQRSTDLKEWQDVTGETDDEEGLKTYVVSKYTLLSGNSYFRLQYPAE